MQRINRTSLKVVKATTSKGHKYLTLKIEPFDFVIDTRNTQIANRVLNDDSIQELDVYLELLPKADKNGKMYLKLDLFVDSEKYLFSIYAQDKNLSFMFNKYIKKLAYDLCDDTERALYGLVGF